MSKLTPLQRYEINNRDGGLHSSNCRCGRPWKARWLPKGAGMTGYTRICPGCKLRTRECTCHVLTAGRPVNQPQ